MYIAIMLMELTTSVPTYKPIRLIPVQDCKANFSMHRVIRLMELTPLVPALYIRLIMELTPSVPTYEANFHYKIMRLISVCAGS